jgi:N-acetylmuramoyl-L-alanine amidase
MMHNNSCRVSETHTLKNLIPNSVNSMLFLFVLLCMVNIVWAQEEAMLPHMLEATVTAVATPVPLQVVVIDAGHGGKNTGVTIEGQITEKTYVLELAKELKHSLRRQARLNVFLTRERDMPVSVLERTTLANRKEADVFVSLHLSGDSRMHIYVNHQVDKKSLSQLYADEVVENEYVVPWDLAQNAQRKKSQRFGKLLASTWEAAARDSEFKDQKAEVEMHVAPIAVLTGICASALLIELPLPKRLDVEAKETIPTMETAEETARKRVAQQLARGILQFLAGR